MVPPYSHRVSRVRRYSGYRWLFRLFVYRTLTFFGWTSHSIPLNLYNAVFCPNPESITTLGLASSAFARHYWRNLVWFLFLPLLRCFSSGGSPPQPIYSVTDSWFFIMCVPTFGYLRLIAYLQLPAAFRSLSRPSSAPNAKAFSICSSSLELLKYSGTFCISFDIHRFSSLELLCFILAVNIFRYSWQNCFFTLNRKTWFRFHDIFVFPFTFVCHVCHTNSFELICYKFLFGFQWTFRLIFSKLSFTVTWFTSNPCED